MQRHAGIGYELVQALDAPVLQIVEQLPDVHHFFGTCPVVAEQVIDDIPPRRLYREPQLAEQLVEVPTILTPSLQNVDTPVPHGGRGASEGLQGFLLGHYSSVPVEQTGDIPASSSGVRRLQTGVQQRLVKQIIVFASVEHIVDFPVSGGGLQDLRPGQSSASSHSPAGFADDAFQGRFFALFPNI